ncbi:MAG: hypothetical protein WCP11_01400 [Candidatus Saccharibacteria bacterium]
MFDSHHYTVTEETLEERQIAKQQDIDSKFDEYSAKLYEIKQRNNKLDRVVVLVAGLLVLVVVAIILGFPRGLYDLSWDMTFGIYTTVTFVSCILLFLSVYLLVSIRKQRWLEEILVFIGQWRSDSGN